MNRLTVVPSLVIGAVLLSLAACQDGRPLAPDRASVPAGISTTSEVSFVDRISAPFGTFDGVAFVRHTGMFEGETSLGEFRVPYEIVAPEDPTLGTGTVLKYIKGKRHDWDQLRVPVPCPNCEDVDAMGVDIAAGDQGGLRCPECDESMSV